MGRRLLHASDDRSQHRAPLKIGALEVRCDSLPAPSLDDLAQQPRDGPGQSSAGEKEPTAG
eukprot:4168747-Pyramimonas_sp.AAC.1